MKVGVLLRYTLLALGLGACSSYEPVRMTGFNLGEDQGKLPSWAVAANIPSIPEAIAAQPLDKTYISLRYAYVRTPEDKFDLCATGIVDRLRGLQAILSLTLDAAPPSTARIKIPLFSIVRRDPSQGSTYRCEYTAGTSTAGRVIPPLLTQQAGVDYTVTVRSLTEYKPDVQRFVGLGPVVN